ncbi:S-adenosylmethionine:tRNA ribosyltransferase-isomerase, partial [Haemophilus influenzae]
TCNCSGNYFCSFY